MIERGVEIGEDGVVGHAREQRHDGAEVVVGRDPTTRAMEEVRGDSVVAGGGGATGDVLDVRVDAEGLHDDDDRSLGGAAR